MEKFGKKKQVEVESIFTITYVELYQPVRYAQEIRTSFNKNHGTLHFDSKSQCLFVTTNDNKNIIIPFTNISFMEYV